MRARAKERARAREREREREREGEREGEKERSYSLKEIHWKSHINKRTVVWNT
jgi:hypothetical protein